MAEERPVVRGAGEARRYEMGPISAVFKADGAETGGHFSISEWWLEPRCEGPGAHTHDDNDKIFYALEGEVSILVGADWRRLPKGSLCVIPRGVTHDFRNEGATRMGLLNVYLPGPFEAMTPSIVDWFRDNPARRLD